MRLEGDPADQEPPRLAPPFVCAKTLAASESQGKRATSVEASEAVVGVYEC